ncbi:putative 2-oxoglutarate dehydrogenase E1 component DHKTD1, mitochondrial, partial [Coemansia sp. RSA 1878]
LPSVKRYGIEGSESIVVLLDQLVFEAAQYGVTDIVAGLSHRGRLGILTSLFEYPKDEVLRKLRGGSEFSDGSPHT